MDFGSLPAEILRLILPSHGKAACIAAQVCSSWRTFIQCQLLQTEAAPQSLPNWCRRWQISNLYEANFAFATLSHIRPQILRFADIYGSNGERLSELDIDHLSPTNHIHLGLPMDAGSFRFFTESSLADDSSCWKNVALMELFFGDDLDRMESWWLLVEHRLSTKPFGAPILGSLRFGSSWQNLYHHASLLSSEACFLYLFHNGQSHGSAGHPEAFCQSQSWHRSLVRSMQQSAAADEHGFSPAIFSGLFGSYGVYNVFVSSSFLPLEDAAIYAASIKSFETPPCLMLSFSGISGRPCRELLLLRNGNLMASCYVKGVCYVNGPRLARRYFRVSFPEDAASPEYRGPIVASSENSDLFRMLCHFSEQLVYMRCSPAPLSIQELESNSDRNFGLTHHGTFPDSFSTATSNRIQVTVSTVLMHDSHAPDTSLVFNADETINYARSKFMYTYQISMQMVEPGPDLMLCRRRWVSQIAGQPAEVIEGEGVVGYNPILRYGEPAFVYQSQTSATCDFSFSGAFLFNPPGNPFNDHSTMTEVTVPKFKFSSFGHLW